MSRLYGMDLQVNGMRKKYADDVVKALQKEWEWDEAIRRKPSICIYGEGYLCGGESEEEFADRVCKAIWEANHGYCYVELRAIYLEDLPSEDYIFEEEDYEEMMGYLEDLPSEDYIFEKEEDLPSEDYIFEKEEDYEEMMGT